MAFDLLRAKVLQAHGCLEGPLHGVQVGLQGRRLEYRTRSETGRSDTARSETARSETSRPENARPEMRF